MSALLFSVMRKDSRIRMRTVDEWKAVLRGAMKEAMRRRDGHAVAALRETLAAIDNAEAVAAPKVTTTGEGRIAGATAGLGAGEAQRRQLRPKDVAEVVNREIEERREAAATYEKLGRSEEASRLREQIRLLESL